MRTRRIHDFSIVDSRLFTFRPEKYVNDSFEIHGITYNESLTFSNKWDSLYSLFKYMYRFRDSLFCCHANHLSFGSYGYFDSQVIRQMAFSYAVLENKIDSYYWYIQQDFKFISTHTIAKKFISLENYRLKTIADNLKIEFEHHKAEDDVHACEQIFKKMVNSDITKEELFQLGNYKFNMEEQKCHKTILSNNQILS